MISFFVGHQLKELTKYYVKNALSINYTSIKSKFSDINLDFVVIHWDSKLLTDITGKSTINRLPVVATDPGIEQLLGVPDLISGMGSEM